MTTNIDRRHALIDQALDAGVERDDLLTTDDGGVILNLERHAFWDKTGHRDAIHWGNYRWLRDVFPETVLVETRETYSDHLGVRLDLIDDIDRDYLLDLATVDAYPVFDDAYYEDSEELLMIDSLDYWIIPQAVHEFVDDDARDEFEFLLAGEHGRSIMSDILGDLLGLTDGTLYLEDEDLQGYEDEDIMAAVVTAAKEHGITLTRKSEAVAS